MHTIKIPCHIVYVRNYFFAKSLLNQLQLEKLNIKILQFCPKALLKNSSQVSINMMLPNTYSHHASLALINKTGRSFFYLRVQP